MVAFPIEPTALGQKQKIGTAYYLCLKYVDQWKIKV